MKRTSTLKRTPIRKVGRKFVEWRTFRNKEFEKDKDYEGLILCQDHKLGMPRCGIARQNMDLHHIYGRDGDLLYDKSKMVWLTRQCHNKIHQEPKK